MYAIQRVSSKTQTVQGTPVRMRRKGPEADDGENPNFFEEHYTVAALTQQKADPHAPQTDPNEPQSASVPQDGNHNRLRSL